MQQENAETTEVFSVVSALSAPKELSMHPLFSQASGGQDAKAGTGHAQEELPGQVLAYGVAIPLAGRGRTF